LIASTAGIDRDFSAITPASTDASAGKDGTPLYCTTAIPAFANVLARSLDPVKSSPIQPSNIVPNHLFPIRFKSKLPSGGVQHIMPIGNYQHEVGLYCLCQMGLQKTAIN
jgi:hypothetical protein